MPDKEDIALFNCVWNRSDSTYSSTEAYFPVTAVLLPSEEALASLLEASLEETSWEDAAEGLPDPVSEVELQAVAANAIVAIIQAAKTQDKILFMK